MLTRVEWRSSKSTSPQPLNGPGEESDRVRSGVIVTLLYDKVIVYNTDIENTFYNAYLHMFQASTNAPGLPDLPRS